MYGEILGGIKAKYLIDNEVNFLGGLRILIWLTKHKIGSTIPNVRYSATYFVLGGILNDRS